MALERKHVSIRTLRRRHERALKELHPELRARVLGALAELGGRFMIWTGHRGKAEQQAALAAGHSHARFGQSPHNSKPALAADVVLNPGVLDLRPHPSDSRYPDLWDDETPEAVAAWADLERAAIRHHLARVNVHGRRDRPHLEMPAWRDLKAP